MLSVKTLNKSLFTAILSVFILCPLAYAASVPHLLNYQGKLTDKDNKPLEGAFDMTLRIYDAETAGNLLWQETQAGVVIQKGVFAVLLGAVTNLNLTFDKPYFLEVKVGEEVLTPRQRIASAGYAIGAEYGVPTGTILPWSADTIPHGYLLCDGSAVSRATYADLFAVIGTKYGQGDGATTFNLPDLRGRFPLGNDNMGGASAGRTNAASADILGGSGGSENKEFSHNHSFSTGADSLAGGRSRVRSAVHGDTDEYHTHSGTTNISGKASIEVMNPYLTLNYLIKY